MLICLFNMHVFPFFFSILFEFLNSVKMTALKIVIYISQLFLSFFSIKTSDKEVIPIENVLF